MKLRRVVAGLALVSGSVFLPSATQPAQACEWPTRQYVVTADSLTLRDWDQKTVKAVLYRGDLFNSGNVEGTWFSGRAYRSNKTYVGAGYVLRQYISYNGNWWC